jgi:hypothetical protein
MSLRDTLEGAQKEAKENVSSLSSPKAKEADESGEKAAGNPRSIGRKSAASGKPAREAASSVRTVSSSSTSKASSSSGFFGGSSGASKEAKKAEQRKQREKEDFRNRGYDLVLRANPEYKRSEKVWWILLGIGFGMTIVSLVMVYVFPSADTELTTFSGVVSVGSLVLAYGFIIGGFIYDWVKRRPMRKAAEKKVQGMTDKKLLDLFERERLEESKRSAAAAAAKRAKKAAKEQK